MVTVRWGHVWMQGFMICPRAQRAAAHPVLTSEPSFGWFLKFRSYFLPSCRSEAVNSINLGCNASSLAVKHVHAKRHSAGPNPEAGTHLGQEL